MALKLFIKKIMIKFFFLLTWRYQWSSILTLAFSLFLVLFFEFFLLFLQFHPVIHKSISQLFDILSLVLMQKLHNLLFLFFRLFRDVHDIHQ